MEQTGLHIVAVLAACPAWHVAQNGASSAQRLGCHTPPSHQPPTPPLPTHLAAIPCLHLPVAQLQQATGRCVIMTWRHNAQQLLHHAMAHSLPALVAACRLCHPSRSLLTQQLTCRGPSNSSAHSRFHSLHCCWAWSALARSTTNRGCSAGPDSLRRPPPLIPGGRLVVGATSSVSCVATIQFRVLLSARSVGSARLCG